jgi:pyruvate/2-oxoglutarate dehydrogenase complex dihydrolipoamide acyltransferase (E2) component
LDLLKDTDPVVRRNAALQLVRFEDAAGRPELRAMLQSFEVKAPFAGTIVSQLPQGSTIRSGALLARIRDTSNNVQEFRSPVDGRLSGPVFTKEGDQVTANQTLVWIIPDRTTVLDALRALAYVGTTEDLPLIEMCVKADPNGELVDQGTQTARAIQAR